MKKKVTMRTEYHEKNCEEEEVKERRIKRIDEEKKPQPNQTKPNITKRKRAPHTHIYSMG